METRKIEISTATILKIIAVLIGLWLVWKILDIILILFVVLIITATLSPTIDWLSAKKVPRILSVILIYFLALAILGGAGYLILPPLIEQIKELAQDLPQILARITPSFSAVKEFYYQQSSYINLMQKPLETLSSQLATFSVNVFSTARGFFAGLGLAVMILVLTFYLLLDKNFLRNFLTSIIPEAQKDGVFSILHQMKIKWGAWMRGQLLLCLITGVIYYIALLILGIPFALSLAVWGGLLEVIPYVGPILAAIPAIIIAFFISPWLALAVLIFFILYQQLEGHILVPKIMQRAVGLSPVIVIVALLIGFKLAGILGAILAVPTAAAGIVLLSEWKNLSIAK